MNEINAFIITYNSAQTIEACLDSLRGKLPAGSLIAVWDNDSCDGTVAIIKEKHSEVRLHASKLNVGFGQGVNGLRKIYGDAKYIMVLNPDAELVELDCRELFNKQTDAVTVGVWGAKIVNEGGKILPSTFAFSGALKEIIKLSEISQHLPIKWKPLLSKLAGFFLGRSFSAYSRSFGANPGRYDWVSGSAMIVRGDLFPGENLFDPGFFLYYEDGDLCMRVKRAGYGVGQLRGFVIRHRAYGSSGYNSPVRLKAELESMVYYRKKWSSRPARLVIGVACLLKSITLLVGLTLIKNEDTVVLSKSYMQAAKVLIR
jgi:N-acetylglucosaminyl-diphospho-decaprenol L-rhamnosyltransferase